MMNNRSAAAAALEDQDVTREQQRRLAANKRASRITQAILTTKRAEAEIKQHPDARATILIREMRLAMLDLLQELS